MIRRIGEKLVIATHNEGKYREISALLEPYGIACVGAAELDLPEPEETGVTFIDNAELKARSAADLSGFPALADDSGLCVDALGGMPGVFSARWADAREGTRDFGQAMERVWEQIRACGRHVSHDAHFACALAIAWPNDGQTDSWEGRVEGKLVWPPRGDKGFGYDAMFQPAGYEQTFGELDPGEKHEISHRARAFRKLVDELE